MTLSIKYRFLILLVALHCFGWSSASAQQEIDLRAQSYTLGLMTPDGVAENLPANDAFRNWIQAHFSRDLRNAGVPHGSYNDRLVSSPTAGWMYEASWQQGEDAVVARFQLIIQGQQLTLLEVGQYQGCICTDCSTVEFSADGRSCECPEGGDCFFVMGEQLH